MAKLRTLFPFTGTLQGATAYTRKDLPGTVLLRSVTGPSREAVRTHPSFANTRRNNREFGGRATAAGWIRRALYPLRHLEDYNVAAALNSLLRPVQQADTDSPFGRRSVCLSRQPYLLEGFNLNRKHSLETTVRHPLVWTLSKETLSARVELPALLAGVNFLAPPPHPWFRLAALLGVVPDLYCEGSKYRPHGDWNALFSQVASTQWRRVKDGAPPTVLELQLPFVPPAPGFSLPLAVGLELGTAGIAGSVEPVRYTGSAKVMAVG